MASSDYPAERYYNNCDYSNTQEYRSARQCLLLVLSIGLTICCACQHENQVPLYPVQGEVYLDSQPAEGALVVLHPLHENPAHAAQPRGFVDKNAHYQLSTRSRHDGAPAGKYAVTVLWRKQSDEDDPGELLVPRHYLDPKQSGLQATIVAGNNTLKAFHLTSE
ncbi:MAG: hypothetical protein CMJ75_09255 [Planctomycetaceae bacterium]|nr:hypothetical protein [Planctomycetaceae bacterium]